jgi:hypothetical protein
VKLSAGGKVYELLEVTVAALVFLWKSRSLSGACAAEGWSETVKSDRIHSPHWRVQLVPEDESSSENRVHCEINDLVQEHIEGQEKVDLVAVAARMAESLVELILLAPEEEQRTLLAATIAHFGNAFLEKSGAIEGESNMTH